MRRPVAALCALLAGLVPLAACAGDGLPAPPGALEDLLPMVPGDVAAERAVYYTDRRATDEGFGTVLPLGEAAAVLGVAPADIEDVLETGGTPLTFLAGDIDADAVVAAVTGHGYRERAEGGWRRFARDEAAPSGAPPLVTAVPAGAVRDGLLVLGSDREVAAVVEGRPGPGWAAGLAAAVGGAAAAAFDGRDRPFEDAATRLGTDLDGLLTQGRVTERLGPYRAAALSWAPDGEFDGAPAEAGVVALLVDPGEDGHEQAAALAIRAATAPVLGDGRRSTTDFLEGGAPRFYGERGLVRLPVRWRSFEPADLREDLDAGHLLFLAPGAAGG